MAVLGYIVQYSDEDDYTVWHGFVKLFRNYTDALERANELYRGYMEKEHNVVFEGPFEVHKPTKKDCDNQGSVVVFESRNFIVWIDCVVD